MKTFFKRRFLCGLLLFVAGVALFRMRYDLTLTWGTSMEPTLNHGTLLIVDRWSYCRSSPTRGDIVIARNHGELLVKRVVALPGEHAAVTKGQFYLNGVLVPEDYISKGKNLEISGGILQKANYALLGDNRDCSSATLVHAIASREAVVGKVVLSLGFPNLAVFQQNDF